MTLPFHPLADTFPLIEGAEFAALVEDVRAHGVREPIVILDGQILDGRNRYRAAREVGGDALLRLEQRELPAGVDPVKFVVSANLRRRHMNESQRALAAAKLARWRVGANQHAAGEGPTQVEAAELLNVSERSVRHAKTVVEQGTPELARAVERGAVAASTAAELAAELPAPAQAEIVARGPKEILKAASEIRRAKFEGRRQERLARIIEISKGNSDLKLPRKFALWVADPAWRYQSPPIGDSNRSIEEHYPTQALDEVCALPVHRYAADDAILYLFVTAPQLLCRTPAGLVVPDQVCRAWGDPHWNDPARADPAKWFTPRAQLIWDKVDEDGEGQPGLGYWVRTQHEFLIIATRGKFPTPPPAARVRSVYRERRGEHSVKPDWFFDRIRDMYPEIIAAGGAIELNARKPRPGFVTWGNQAPQDTEAA